MKKTVLFLVYLSVSCIAFSQIDTISTNIYQVNNKLGIGTTVPHSELSVVNDNDTINYNEYNSIADFQRKYNNSVARFLIFGYPDTDKVLDHLRKSVMLYSTADAKDMVICASQPEGQIRFFTQTWMDPSSERMRIDNEGNVGIGTVAPQSRLEVSQGDIYISDIDKGIIMKSPDGGCWRGVLNNFGELVFSQVDCPEGPNLSVISSESYCNYNLYPNPSNGIITIENNNTNVRKINYRIYDVTGKLIDTGKLRGNKSSLDLTGVKTGTYFLNLTDKGGNVLLQTKLIKE